jgi:hypothetical protein
MLGRLTIGLVAAAVLAALLAPTPARAADRIVAHDTLIQYVWPLDGDLVYVRGQVGKPLPKRVWMARYKSHLREATGIPREAFGGSIGLDAKGRKVFVFTVARSGGDGVDWFLYDLASNRSRPLTGLPTDPCFAGVLGVWRDTLAYETRCQNEPYPTAFLRQRSRTRRLGGVPGNVGLSYRAGTLAVIVDTGLDDFYVMQVAANGKPCSRRIDASYGDATDDAGWFPTDLWVVNGYVVWTMGVFALRPDFAILAAKVPPGCGTPGPVGQFRFKPETKRVVTVAVDEGRVFYADDKTLRSHAEPAKPSFARPSNDNFKNAKRLSGKAPISATGNVAYATVQHGEPLADTKHTVWYAYRPTKEAIVYVTVSGACRTPPDNCGGLPRFGVYRGSSPSKLTEIRQSGGPYTTRYTAVHVHPGRTYWIAVGSPLPEPRHEPFTVRIDKSRPPR